MSGQKLYVFIFSLIFCCIQLSCVSHSKSKLPLKSNVNTDFNQKNVIKPVSDEQLETNRKLWSETNIKDYDFKIEIRLIAPTDFPGPVEIKVRQGKAVDFLYLKNAQNIDDLQAKFENYSTVERLFDFVQNKLEEKRKYLDTGKPLIGKFNVTYDTKAGFPNEIIYIPLAGEIDGDMSIIIKDFVNLTSKKQAVNSKMYNLRL